MGKPYRISGDPYAGEVMNVQRENDGTFYAEIPALNWNSYNKATPLSAVHAVMDRIKREIEARPLGGILKKKKSEIEECQYLISYHEARLVSLQREAALIRDRQRSGNQNITVAELEAFLDDKNRVEKAMKFLSPDSPFPADAVGFKPFKDIDGDGDMEHAWIAWSKHKKLVKRDT